VSLPGVAILAGGLATRLGERSKKTPKSLIPVAGSPFIHHQLKLLASQGLSEVVVCAGHLGEMIQGDVKDGSGFGLKIQFAFDGPKLLGTGGALKKALPLLSDPFFVLYGDSYLEVPMAPMAMAFATSGKPALMAVFKNENQWDRSNIEYENGRILAYDKTQPSPAMRHIDYGLGLISKKALASEAEDAFDLPDFYGKLVSQGQLAAYEVKERFYEIGSEKGLAETEAHLSKR
jgi:NDP-sugar pyrophosphorylase family protein